MNLEGDNNIIVMQYIRAHIYKIHVKQVFVYLFN